MNIPEGYKLVPVNPTEIMQDFGCSNMPVDWASPFEAAKVYSAMVGAAPNAEIPAYDEAKELAACGAHWDKNPNCLFSDMWLGWKACAQSRDGSVGDE